MGKPSHPVSTLLPQVLAIEAGIGGHECKEIVNQNHTIPSLIENRVVNRFPMEFNDCGSTIQRTIEFTNLLVVSIGGRIKTIGGLVRKR